MGIDTRKGKAKMEIIRDGWHKEEITHHKIQCPACRQEVEAVAHDGIIKGYCSVKKRGIWLKMD
jgi:hypothetical protein